MDPFFLWNACGRHTPFFEVTLNRPARRLLDADDAGVRTQRRLGRKRVIQRLFNVGVLEAMSERKASTL